MFFSFRLSCVRKVWVLRKLLKMLLWIRWRNPQVIPHSNIFIFYDILKLDSKLHSMFTLNSLYYFTYGRRSALLIHLQEPRSETVSFWSQLSYADLHLTKFNNVLFLIGANLQMINQALPTARCHWRIILHIQVNICPSLYHGKNQYSVNTPDPQTTPTTVPTSLAWLI